jgi:RNA polymerase sigma factor (sigma-70 family)
MGEGILNDTDRVTEILPGLKSFIRSKVSEEEDANDLVSEVCLALALNTDRWKGDSNFKNYAYGIAKNKITDFLRRKYRVEDNMIKLKNHIKEETMKVEDKVLDSWINNDLTKAEFEVFKLVGLGKSNVDIASELFVSLGTIRTHLKSIHKKIGCSGRNKLVAVAQAFLKVHENHKEWLEKFYSTYIRLGEKNNHLTGQMKEDATQAKENMLKRLGGE